ncbi:hypothetical protein KSP39_PZI013930 [Platanthera zijinensis]|uniref:Uncharacterized protein n=1 Tax=Platanthera zijinensis TaxID=2320716 RepID=A0AAP0BDM6_9ASPA
MGLRPLSRCRPRERRDDHLTHAPWNAAGNLAAASRTNLKGAPAISGTTGFDGSGGHIAELNMTSSYMMNSPWDFKDDESGSSSLEMGIRHAPDTGHGCFSGELGLALQSPDDFGHHAVYNHDHHHHQAMHWAL